MRAKEFITEEDVHPDYDDFMPVGPFSETTLLHLPVFHSTDAKFKQFERVTHGIFVSQHYDYASSHYGSTVIPLYVDVRKCYPGTSRDAYVDAAFARDYKELALWLEKFRQEGYDCAPMFGDGDSLILIGDVPMVHAVTGEKM